VILAESVMTEACGLLFHGLSSSCWALLGQAVGAPTVHAGDSVIGSDDSAHFVPGGI
jgi:hypothetical protein